MIWNRGENIRRENSYLLGNSRGNQKGNKNHELDCKQGEMVLDADGNRNNQELDSGVGPLRPVLEQLGDGNETDKGNSTDRNLEK